MLKFFIIGILFGYCFCSIPFDLTQTNKYGDKSILDSQCNKDTQIDLYLNQGSNFICTTGTCVVSGLNSSYMKFMDINGDDLVLTLNDARVVSNTFAAINGIKGSPAYYFLMRFQTDGAGRTVYVLTPVTNTVNTTYGGVLDATGDKSGLFSGIKGAADGATIPLTAFRYLNNADYGNFYHVTNAAKTQTVLLGSTVVYIPAAIGANDPSYTFSPDYKTSGDKLCFASNQVGGYFQSHLRESWPLWTCIISCLFYWLYYLLSDSETNTCYDKRFQQNRMTSWGFYSLHFLGHVQYFSRLSRVSLLYFVFSFQAMVLAALYSTLGDDKQPYTNYQMIIWTALIAFAASLPIPYLLGGLFLRPIYRLTLQKFRLIKKSRQTMMKKTEQQAIIEAQIDKVQEKLYTRYYWYYIIFFAGFICFWVPSIYMMMRPHRNYYYLHRIWLASLAITFVIDNLIVDPILARLIGHTACYKVRGYFYNFALGQEFKQIEQ